MKILITTDCYRPMVNGVVTSVTTLERELTDKGHEVRIVTLSETHRFAKRGNVYYMGSVGAGKLYPQARAAAPVMGHWLREIEEWRPDIIHSQSEFSSFFAARRIAALLDIPIVHTYHTVYEDYTHYFSPNEALGKRATALLSRVLLNSTQAAVVPTDKVKKILQRYGVTTPIYVVPSGISLDQFTRRPDRNRIGKLRAGLGISESKKVMVTVGRLAKEKNVEELLDYFDRLNRPELELVIVGDGPHREALEAHAARLSSVERIHFAGMAAPEEVADYYHLGDVFLCASRSETQGLTYIEALSSGLPVIGRSDDCIDGIVVDGVNGYRYETFEDFERAARRILDGENIRVFSENARQKGLENGAAQFSERILAVYHRTLEEFCGRRRGGFGPGRNSGTNWNSGTGRNSGTDRNCGVGRNCGTDRNTGTGRFRAG